MSHAYVYYGAHRVPLLRPNSDLLELHSLTVEEELVVNKFRLSTPVWEDMRFPATGINPPGAAADPVRNTTTGLLDFSASATNTIALTGQFSHTWKIGSTVEPHLHIRYANANTGNSVWQFQYEIADLFTSFPEAFVSETKTFAAPGVARYHMLHPFTPIDMSAYTGLSVTINMLISRLGGDGADTYGAVMPLLEFDIHHQVDGLGSTSVSMK